MLASDLNPEPYSFALVKDALHDDDGEKKLQHLREVLSDNVIVAGWINNPNRYNNAETLIADLIDRVQKFETNQHLRALEWRVFG